MEMKNVGFYDKFMRELNSNVIIITKIQYYTVKVKELVYTKIIIFYSKLRYLSILIVKL